MRQKLYFVNNQNGVEVIVIKYRKQMQYEIFDVIHPIVTFNELR